ncbi:MAG: MarR family transcriptional regulator [Treponemataceae bacterium]|nr:MarR family transcriptional regulator [Treponemataceae bacterium]
MQIHEMNNLMKSVGILYRTFLNYCGPFIKKQGLCFSESVFLINIALKEGLSQDGLASELAIDKGAVARSIKTLTQKGLVFVKKEVPNKRINQLYLTSQGKKLAHYIQHIHYQWVTVLLEQKTPQEQLFLKKTLEEMSNIAKEKTSA